ncbi:MAG: acyltransferase [Pseudomonadota bacterium]
MTAIETDGPAPADLRPLTTLRFFAAAWVVLFACWPHLDVGFMPNLVAKGYLGVETFFILSGFILSHVYLEQAGGKRLNYAGFLWARIARVYPLHIATLFGVMALGLAATFAGLTIDSNVLSWKSLPAQLLMIHAWGFAPEAGFNHPSWSISAEWFAYLAFPLFAAVAWALRKRPGAAVAGAGAFMIGLYLAFEAVAGFPLTRATFAWGALRIVPCFALGCALYLVHRRGALPRPGLIAALCGAGMTALASINAWDGFIVLLAGGLILALGSLPNIRAGWLSSRAGVYLGEISYSIYMVAVPVKLVGVNLAARLTGAEDKLLHPLAWLAVVACIPLAAACSYHLIEKPARKALRSLADRRAIHKSATKARTRLA